MAIAFEAVGGATQITTTSLTWSHTVTASSNYLVVFVATTSTNGTLNDVSSVTYNGVAMTQIDTLSDAGAGNRIYSYVLPAPDTGTNNVIATFATSKGRINGVSGSYTGVYQSTTPDSHNVETDSVDGTPTTTVVNSDCWVIAGEINDSGTPTAGTGTTLRGSVQNTSYLADSNGTVSPGANTLTFTGSTGWLFNSAIISLSTTGPATATRPSTLLLMGVG